MLPEIQVNRFHKDSDLYFLNDWLRAHGEREVDETGVPELGFLCFAGGVPVCAAFLRRCEGNWGIVEGMTSNPEASSEVRHAALDALLAAITRQAEAFRMTNLLAWTQDASTLVRSARHGYRQLPQSLIAKDMRSLLAN